MDLYLNNENQETLTITTEAVDNLYLNGELVWSATSEVKCGVEFIVGNIETLEEGTRVIKNTGETALIDDASVFGSCSVYLNGTTQNVGVQGTVDVSYITWMDPADGKYKTLTPPEIAAI